MTLFRKFSLLKNNHGHFLPPRLVTRLATKIQNGRRRSTPKFFVGAKNLIKGFTEIQNDHHGSRQCFVSANDIPRH